MFFLIIFYWIISTTLIVCKKHYLQTFSNMASKPTRKERTTEFRDKVEQEWKTTYLEFIKEYMDKPGFNWFNLTRNPNIDPQYIFDNPHLQWDVWHVIQRLDIPIDTLIAKYGADPESLSILMNREDVTMEYIESHPEYPWPYSQIYSLKKLSIDFIKKHEDEVDFWNCLQFHTGYTLKEFLIAFPGRVYEPDLIYRTGMTFEEALKADSDILEVLAKNTRYHPRICELVTANPDLKWNWNEISFNPNLTVEFMHKYRKQINWVYLTTVMPKQVIRANHKLPWDYRMYSYRTDLTRAELFEHLPSYYDTFMFGCHPQIRFADFKNEGNIKWNINSVSANTFDAEKEAFITRKYAEYLSAYRIQQQYNLVISSPEYTICRKRVSADYDREFLDDDCLMAQKKTQIMMFNPES